MKAQLKLDRDNVIENGVHISPGCHWSPGDVSPLTRRGLIKYGNQFTALRVDKGSVHLEFEVVTLPHDALRRARAWTLDELRTHRRLRGALCSGRLPGVEELERGLTLPAEEDMQHERAARLVIAAEEIVWHDGTQRRHPDVTHLIDYLIETFTAGPDR